MQHEDLFSPKLKRARSVNTSRETSSESDDLGGPLQRLQSEQKAMLILAGQGIQNIALDSTMDCFNILSEFKDSASVVEAALSAIFKTNSILRANCVNSAERLRIVCNAAAGHRDSPTVTNALGAVLSQLLLRDFKQFHIQEQELCVYTLIDCMPAVEKKGTFVILVDLMLTLIDVHSEYMSSVRTQVNLSNPGLSEDQRSQIIKEKHLPKLNADQIQVFVMLAKQNNALELAPVFNAFEMYESIGLDPEQAKNIFYSVFSKLRLHHNVKRFIHSEMYYAIPALAKHSEKVRELMTSDNVLKQVTSHLNSVHEPFKDSHAAMFLDGYNHVMEALKPEHRSPALVELVVSLADKTCEFLIDCKEGPSIPFSGIERKLFHVALESSLQCIKFPEVAAVLAKARCWMSLLSAINKDLESELVKASDSASIDKHYSRRFKLYIKTLGLLEALAEVTFAKLKKSLNDGIARLERDLSQQMTPAQAGGVPLWLSLESDLKNHTLLNAEIQSLTHFVGALEKGPTKPLLDMIERLRQSRVILRRVEEDLEYVNHLVKVPFDKLNKSSHVHQLQTLLKNTTALLLLGQFFNSRYHQLGQENYKSLKRALNHAAEMLVSAVSGLWNPSYGEYFLSLNTLRGYIEGVKESLPTLETNPTVEKWEPLIMRLHVQLVKALVRSRAVMGLDFQG
ncbi:hypothetical protein GUITHDRAFT_114112 [Guillardia theta CCMP2712]|uniref:Uncharacterized protein n=1 Tax=Guillardia theta (strain CCMP2712) TaxID=905079 RepID=L1IVF8_GUITC|nr:hypothetical protein GUITHDRAFT_114112 [Guillardia theta CCMP2712]EKX39864.1 hypothetical protein GUITHDRAFT_114112 [Guillardia theta CCMP2712]|eukprot:XP_005826844.1 hypothetical protein GUITHDRAFT_114112 [Guillardia theta CCMP2712]